MGFTLYQLDQLVYQQLSEGFSYDEETGEIISKVDLDSLVSEKERGYVLYIKNLKAEIKAMEDEKKNLDVRIKSAKKKSELLQKTLLNHMNATGKKKLSDPRYEVRTRVSHPVVIDNEQAIIDKGLNGADDLISTKVSISKTGVKAHIDELEGLAHIGTNTSLTIK